MSTQEQFFIRRAGGRAFATGSPGGGRLRAELRQAMDTMWPKAEVFNMKGPAMQSWTGSRTQAQVIDQIAERFPHVPVGARFRVRRHEGERQMVCKKILRTEGSAILAAALRQLGVDYVWADEDPAGGGSAGFDCSGLTKWSYDQGADIILPHSAQAQMTDGQVTTFTDKGKLKDGDLVFYHVGRLPSGQADHVGIVDVPGMVVDASSSADMVVHRAIDANPILRFGRVREANGPL